jgi:putative flavoprotein involved in K+ transport
MRTTTLIIGGGQAGLAMSWCLTDRGIDHVVLERGRVAERWRSERWDSLRLLTPNWMSRLPSWRYEGSDPDGYMTVPEVIGYLERYAHSFDAPVVGNTSVTSVDRHGEGYEVSTTAGTWRASNVVIATGYCDVPLVPPLARLLPPGIAQFDATRYRHPGQLPDGGVLVVGASATGIQLAAEIHASGRPVTLAVGRHTRLPRYYRGRDILWWLDAMGVLDDRLEDVYDAAISREQPSMQLVGRPDRQTIDLPALARKGVRIVGRLTSVDGSRVAFDDGLAATTAAADVKLAALLQRVDRFIQRHEAGAGAGPQEPFVPSWPMFIEEQARTIDLRAEGVRSVLWATGFARRYPWLRVPVLDRRGEIRHHGGVTGQPGLYVLGLHFQRRRKSGFIDGVGDDAVALGEQIVARLRGDRSAVA